VVPHNKISKFKVSLLLSRFPKFKLLAPFQGTVSPGFISHLVGWDSSHSRDVAKFTTKFDAEVSLIPWFISLEHFIEFSDFAFCQLMKCAKVVDDHSKHTLDVLVFVA
jgi:hypothetical protein